MKNHTILIIILALAVTLPACAQFSCSIGLGYRSLPEGTSSPLFTQAMAREILSADAARFALTPAQIEMILKFLSGDNFKYMFPSNSRNELGIWAEIIAKSGEDHEDN